MLKKNLVANYLGQSWAAVMGFAFIPLYIKYLGIEAYGLIGLFALLQAWLSLLDMGMTPTLGREMARFTGGSHTAESIRDLLRSIELISLGIAILIAGGIALGANWTATHWLQAEALPVEVVAQAFTVMGVVTALRFAESVYRSSIVGLQRQVLFNVVNSVMATIRGLGAVGVLLWVSASIEAFFIWQGLVSVATLMILAGTTYATLPRAERAGRFSIEALRGVWRFAGGILLMNLVALLNTQIDKLIVSAYATLREYAIYALAIVVANVVFMLVTPVTQAFYPKLAANYAKDNATEFKRRFHEGSQVITIIVGTASLAIIFNTEILLGLWLQDKDLTDDLILLVTLLCVGNMLNAYMYMPVQAQLATGWTSFSVKMGALSSIVTVALVMALVPSNGVLMAALIWISIRLAQFLIAPYYVFKKILVGEMWSWYFRDIFIPMLVIGGVFTSVSIFDKFAQMTSISYSLSVISVTVILALFLSAISANALNKQIVILIQNSGLSRR